MLVLHDMRNENDAISAMVLYTIYQKFSETVLGHNTKWNITHYLIISYTVQYILYLY